MSGSKNQSLPHKKRIEENIGTLLVLIRALLFFPGLFILFLAPPILIFVAVDNNSIPEWLGIILFVADLVAYHDLISRKASARN